MLSYASCTFLCTSPSGPGMNHHCTSYYIHWRMSFWPNTQQQIMIFAFDAFSSNIAEQTGVKSQFQKRKKKCINLFKDTFSHKPKAVMKCDHSPIKTHLRTDRLRNSWLLVPYCADVEVETVPVAVSPGNASHNTTFGYIFLPHLYLHTSPL